MTLTKQFTNSSQVKQIDYKPEEKILEVIFLTGKKYQYLDVPQELWLKALEAESIGKFLNSEVKGKFTYKQI